MNKKEFLKELEIKLGVLEDSEIRDILSEYSDHIDHKISSGKTEEEAIKDFGDINDLAKEILSAYKINDKYVGKNSFEEKVDNFVDKAVKFFQSFAKKLSEMETKSIIDVIVKIIIVFILLAIIQIPFHLLNGLMLELLRAIPVLSGVLVVLWRIVGGIVFFVISIAFLYYAFKYLLNKEFNINGKTIGEHIDDEIKKSKEAKTYQKEEKVADATKNNTYEKKESYEKKKSSFDDTSAPNLALSIIVKTFAVIFIIPFICAIVGLSIAFAFFVALIFKGIILFEVLLILLGLIFVFGAISGMIHYIAFKVVR